MAISPDRETPEEAADGKTKKTSSGPDWMERTLRVKRGWIRWVALVVVALIIVYALGSAISRLWTDYLWYEEVGHTNVWSTPIVARILVGLFFAVIFFGFLYGNIRLARRQAPRFRPVSEANDNNVLELITRRRWSGRLLLLVAIVVAIIVGIAYGGRWQTVLLFLNRQEFGYVDPAFGRDASFYVYTLPLWSMLVNFVGVAVLLTGIAVVFTYVADRALALTASNRVALAPHVKAHLSGLLALAMVAKAGDYALQRWELNYSLRGATFGAHYTDLHATLPILTFLAIVSLIAAAIFLINIRFRGWRLPAIAIAVMFLTWIFAGKVYPYAIQQWQVSPNEITKESPYIARNIEATRWAYDLDKVTEIELAATTDLTADDVRDNVATTSNIRLWEPRPALSAYTQIQAIRLYYTFTDVDIDRYVVDGRFRQVLVSARELDQGSLEEQSKTWVNQHFTYTHGYGIVASPVNEATSDGQPLLFVSNIPPVSKTDLEVTRPEIYYGELGNAFVVVRTTNPEFDYPVGNSYVPATYEGDGGVPIDSRLRRAAFGFRFNSLKLFFSSSFTDESRVMYRRTIRERVEGLAPFLTFDKDPYMIVRDDGSLVWMWDAYTTTGRFPYSQPRADGLNYIRNAVKVVIDAYNGDVTLYQVDPDDPVANTWGAVFEGLFTPGDQMPEDLRRHMRYPEDYYSVQAEVLSTYHMTDTQIFYNKEDVWEIPTEIYAADEIPVVPYYQVLALPGETDPEFVLVQPFAPLNKKNMISLLVARQDGESYGELVTIRLPKDKLIFGPAQVEARISNDPLISEQLTLWNQSGSQVIRGNLLVVPINQSIMYFEPVYLQAAQSPIPELARVIAVYGDRVLMEPTLSDALTKIFGEPIDAGTSGSTSTTAPPSSTTTTQGTTTTTVPSSTTTTVAVTTTTGGGTALPTDAASLIALATEYYGAALQAQRDGDWAEYGRLIAELGRVLEALEAAQ